MAQAHHSLKFGILVLTAGLLAGCPAPTTRPLPSGMTEPGAPAPRPPPPTRENRLSPATQSLVAQSRNLIAHGDLDAASSTLDRALRIDPNNPLLWIERGRLRLTENDAHQAEGCGRKALALASGDHSAQRQAGLLLADALRAQNRNQEAHTMESQPFMK